jgi:hypothetical protein
MPALRMIFRQRRMVEILGRVAAQRWRSLSLFITREGG